MSKEKRKYGYAVKDEKTGAAIKNAAGKEMVYAIERYAKKKAHELGALVVVVDIDNDGKEAGSDN